MGLQTGQLRFFFATPGHSSEIIKFHTLFPIGSLPMATLFEGQRA